jgi:hypothetical protein
MAASTILINQSGSPVNNTGNFVVYTTDINGLNSLPQVVMNGQQWNVVPYATGLSMQAGSAWSPSNQFAVMNMDQANITISVYQDGKLLATQSGVLYYETVAFYFSSGA